MPTLSSDFDGLTAFSQPHQYFQKIDGPDLEYNSRAINSENYRSWRHATGKDGKTKDGRNKKCYGNAADIEYADMRTLDAGILLAGLDPCPSRDMQFTKGRLAVIGRRIADLVTRERSQMVRKFHHPSDMAKEIPRGSPGFDNLAPVAPMAKSLGEACIRCIASLGRAQVSSH